MKKYFLFACVAAALVSCSSDEYLGNEMPLTQNESGAILFAGTKPSLTRATLTGKDAADKLNGAFVVYGTKHAAAEDNKKVNDELVFDNYKVTFDENTAGTAEDNTHNWAYVGNDAYSSNVSAQSIKYWDFSADEGYTFTAFSSKDISYPAASTDKVVVEKITEVTGTGASKYDKGYTVTVKEGASLDNLFYSDRVEVAKDDYKKPVVFTFRNFGSRVRVGFYETVPGYKVKIDKFYYDADAAAAVTTYGAMADASTTNFKAALQNVKAAEGTNNNVITVSYYDDTDANIENQVKAVNNTTVKYNYDLELGTGITAATALETSSATPTWDNGGDYTTVYPFEANDNPMLIRVDYTLTSEDGSDEKIHVKNARAVVPVQYVQWKSNTAYTYLFKISTNTNGTTGDVPVDPDAPTTTDDPEGLFPITFDAVVINTEEATQETITTIATKDITTYGLKSNVTANNEYKKDTDIYAVISDPVSKDNIAATGVGATAGKVNVYPLTGSAAGDATEAEVLSLLTGGKPADVALGTALSASLEQYVPKYDGTDYDFGADGAVLFTPDAAGKYAVVYCETAYVAPTEANQASATFDPTKTYYFKSTLGVYSAASGLSADNWDTYKAKLYTLTGGTKGVYTIKVVKVVD